MRSTAFLVGPEQQINMMFLSTLPLSMLDASFLHSFCALLIHSKILTVIAILCKTCALMWYNLSYIPFARRIVSEIMILSL
ncbi:vesicle transport protein SFT2B [Brassica napus]|uniref:vesicle transport protein SFT2B n=1 Tax=Brassica napus TaxID=3708 RepID=UPI002078BAC0|nr:vesicle transport protein SFT2B [Brassica napus]XP_048612641.1 vesicle transport protein SFT2B [Brassica napus]